jgi:hypothetical protein
MVREVPLVDWEPEYMFREAQNTRRKDMKPRNLFFVVAVVILVSAPFSLMSQGLTDGVKVTLPEPVSVGDVVLDPGEYEIRRASTVTDQVLQIFSKDKLRYQTNVLTVPALDKDTPERTKVLLHHIGDKYYFDKIWMEGKDYGYEFVLPDRVSALQRELAVTVPATYQTAEEKDSSQISKNSSEDLPVAREKPSSESPAIPGDLEKDHAQIQQEAQQPATPPQAPLQSDQSQSTQDRNVQAERDRQERAELDQVAALQREPAPVTPNPAAARPEPAPQDNAPKELPATASEWFAYVLLGGLLLTMAAILRPGRARQ